MINASVEIRQDEENDQTSVLKLVAELLDDERRLWADRVAGKTKVEEYLDDLGKEMGKNQGRMVVATMGGEVVGYAAGHVLHERDNKRACFYVDDVVVTRKKRNRGICKALITSLERYARDELRLTLMGIGVLSHNEGAKSIYRHLGFEEYGIELVQEI